MVCSKERYEARSEAGSECSKHGVLGLEKRFGKTAALRGVDLDFEPGRITVVLGPSGCGKSTLLRILAGLSEPDRGTVVLDGRTVNDPRSRVPPEMRGIGMVFQDSLLWPHLTVRRNIGLSLGKGDDVAAQVKAAAEASEVEEFLDRYPAELSGGEQRRVAIARAVVGMPRLLLLDEPLSGLDANLRVQLLGTISGIQRSLGLTTVYVTHDQKEALDVADRVAVLRRGRLEQVGTPEEIYLTPRTAFVAGFVGLSTRLVAELVDGEITTVLGGFPAGDGTSEGAVLVVRPEQVELGSEEGVAATVVRSSFRGDRWLTELRASDQELLAYTAERRAAGEEVRVKLRTPPLRVLEDREDA